jgi:magnesium-transporting ATPase (P-type)
MRPVGLSLPYFLTLLFIPFSPTPTKYNISNKGVYIYKTLIISSFINLFLHIAIQILEYLNIDLTTKCDKNLEYILRHLGLVQFKNIEIKYIIYWVTFDIGVLLASGLFLYIVKKLYKPLRMYTRRSQRVIAFEANHLRILVNIGVFFSLLFMCLAGIAQPSILNLLYFITYMCIASWWGLNQKFRRSFGNVLLMISIYGALHLILILFYQNPWPQHYLEEYPYIRDILGFKAILLTNCGKKFILSNTEDLRKIDINLNYHSYVT